MDHIKVYENFISLLINIPKELQSHTFRIAYSGLPKPCV